MSPSSRPDAVARALDPHRKRLGNDSVAFTQHR